MAAASDHRADNVGYVVFLSESDDGDSVEQKGAKSFRDNVIIRRSKNFAPRTLATFVADPCSPSTLQWCTPMVVGRRSRPSPMRSNGAGRGP